MAVYKRTYKNYAGAPTWTAWRFLVLTRFGLNRVFQSKMMILFVGACLFGPILCIAFVYLSHNPPFLAAFSIPANRLPPVNGRFFYFYSMVQGALAYLLAAFVGPSLISPDLANGAMPLYFSRPLSRTKYVAGKLIVLLLLLSLITWIPGSVVFLVQASVAGWDWTKANFWLEGSIVMGLVVWILVLSLIALALSAWVKWKIAAGALLLGVIFAGAGFGMAINSLMRTSYGSLIDLSQVVHTIWSDLFRYDTGTDMSVGSAWVVLGLVSALSVWLLARRIRPFEVIK
jgi:ABC-2 type transport system permease protein